MRDFPSDIQLDEKDCGPTCLKNILKFYGKSVPIQELIDLCETTRIGTSLLNISRAAEGFGLRTLGTKVTFETLSDSVLPCIVFWRQKHFVVVYKIKGKKVYISDPAHGLITYSKEEFLQQWIGVNVKDEQEGIALFIEPTASFNATKKDVRKEFFNFSYLAKYLTKYKKLLFQLCVGLIAASAIQLSFPFLTQTLVDQGIQNQDLGLITLVLVAQLMLFFGRIMLEVIRGWILLHIGARVRISLLSDFFIKLMKLPISYFDIKVTGDLIQRISDNKKIENFLTVTSLSALFSLINIVLFGAILSYYSIPIFLIYLAGSLIYFLWISAFQKRRKDFHYRLFSHLGEEQTKTIELIQGMQEIKLNNAETEKRWGWDNIQAKIFKIDIKNLSLSQYQVVGASFINELKNIIITVVAAKLVVDGQLTLGMMLSISYIVGQLNGPLSQMIELLHSTQDAKISLERLSEIQTREDETAVNRNFNIESESNTDLIIQNVFFRYKGSNEFTLKNINFTIPFNKVTAIVGASGSGKTTLMKLLLKIYEPDEGEIALGHTSLRNIPHDFWRKQCGVVMQEGYLFNDTIAGNITLGTGQIDRQKLHYALTASNCTDFVNVLPLGVNTKIGYDGMSLSLGQKQRLLIARAIYRDPKFIFLDEATSSLDANNEKEVISNLEDFFNGRTVVIIAHRLSTVKNADQIIVLTKNGIAEIGNHRTLVNSKGHYYNLVKNQLELGS